MTAEYKVRLLNRSGALIHEIDHYLSLDYVRIVNAPGMALLVIPGDHAAASEVDLDYQLEVWRRDVAGGLEWERDFSGLVRDIERTLSEDGVPLATLYAPGDLSLLGRAIVGYKAATANRSKFTSAKGETILKTLVTYNATSSGTAVDGRVRDVDLSGVTVQADGAGGNTLDVGVAWQNLLTACQDIARVAGGDFDLVKTAATTWEFRWYAGQLGTDKSATIVFSLDRGNMTNPYLRRNTLEETTVAIVGGQGEESARTVVIRTAAAHAAGYRSVETFVDGATLSTTAGLNAAGDRELDSSRAAYTFTFDVLQIAGTLYGVHYDLGDLVTAAFLEYSATKKITEVHVKVDELYGEQIMVVMSDA